MKVNFKQFYRGFISTILALFSAYILISSSFSIIYPQGKLNFVNIILNLTYLVFVSFVMLFFVGILLQIMLNFKTYQHQANIQWKQVLKVNWLIIILWIFNLSLFSYCLYVTVIYNNYFDKHFYQTFLISFYLFYGIFSIGFVITLVLFRIYIAWIKDISNITDLNNLTILKYLAHDDLVKTAPYNFTITFPNIYELPIAWFLLEEAKLISNLRKTHLLTQFKKQTTPPHLFCF
ncbi:hypothetical protein P344_01820 [Spiroplasma mirum ATCC 29335]|uniref:Uncharacterized protein n=1 Tax=Spiroplasma mirum ATCC 29335 TaxID=838561 RepID=W0GKP8_9MOLU|nr:MULTISPECIES: hypothetical protein [Spiroplasma]AHF60752.1 putative transmembrane protein [Spiroplasma mirum ATCC 29335]AHI57712.1 hypothetical protein P344_01820 [Spiroplasma mirum ATCC 29335]AKM52871.1 hypothetical protein SATRI_v1c03440 [Spiroplasma atrichopogonis]